MVIGGGDAMYAAAMITTQCAWCREVKLAGRYVELGLTSLIHEIDLPGKNGRTLHYVVSHGVCDPCKERLIARPLAA
jgi:hypothetical protein